jgi:hypothetical protein
MSTIVSTSQVSGNNPSKVGGTGTGIVIFPSILGQGFNNGNSQTTSVGPAQVTLAAPQSEGIQSVIKASGNFFLHGTSPTIKFLVYKGTSLTATSDTLVASTTSAISGLTTAASYPFALSLSLQGDANSGLIQGYSPVLYVNGASQTLTVASSGIPLTSQDLLTTPVQFCIGVQFGVSDALNAAYLQQFVLEQ